MDHFELTAVDGLLSLRDQTAHTPPYAYQLNFPTPSSIVSDHKSRKTSISSGWSDSSQRSAHIDLRYHEHIIPRRNQQVVSVTLPPISSLIAQYPLAHTRSNSRNSRISIHGPRSSNISQFTRVVPYHPYRREVFVSPVPSTATIDRIVVDGSQHFNESQAKRHHNPAAVLRYIQQLQTKILLLAQEHHRLLSAIQPGDKSELIALFQGFKQVYGDEFKYELLQPQDTVTNIETDDVDDSSNSNDDSSDPGNGKKFNKEVMKRYLDKKATASGTDKPRWTMLEKSELFEAIIKHKKLGVMSSFNWAEIGADCGKQDKACKDQWRRGVLKMLRDSFEEDF
ncbi:unnamed protein product [Mucor hiemalis]